MNISHRKLSLGHQIVVALVILSASYAVISGSAARLGTVQWDEFVDLRIAENLSFNPLKGSIYDKSQARFPMYVTALVHRSMQIFKQDFELLDLLPVSRWISIFMTVLAIWGTFFLGYRLFNPPTALLAATLFTFSPYVLQFGHAALTEGDAFTPATVVFALIAFERFDFQRTTAWLAVFAVFLALAIASKFFLVILIPALITYHMIFEDSNILTSRLVRHDSLRLDIKDDTQWACILLGMGTGLLALLALVISRWGSKQPADTAEILYRVSIGLWLVTLLGIGSFLCIAFNYSRKRKSASTSSVRWSSIWAWLTILPLSFSMVLALFPEHIFNPHISSTLLGRAVTLDGKNEVVATLLDSAKLYLGILLFKMGLPFGLLTCVALVWAAIKSSHTRAFPLISLVLLFYGLMLAVMPLQQSFWLMSVYPLILLLLSALIVHNLRTLQKIKLRIWMGYVAASVAWLAVGLFNVYPTFGYYGYELIGERWLGSESRGYRGVVVVTNDGSKEAINWLRKNVPNGSVVLSYLNDLHLVKYLVSKDPVGFELEHASNYVTETETEKTLAKAEFVVVRLINDFGKATPVTNRTFIETFGSAPAYEIFRGRGIYRFPVIQIYQRIRGDTPS